MNAIPIAVALPLPEDVVDRAARRKVLRQYPPLAARLAQKVKQSRAQRLAHVRRARSAAGARQRDQRRELVPTRASKSMLTFGQLARRNGLTWSGKDAFVELDRRVTWGAFDERTDALGHALRAFGIAPGRPRRDPGDGLHRDGRDLHRLRQDRRGPRRAQRAPRPARDRRPRRQFRAAPPLRAERVPAPPRRAAGACPAAHRLRRRPRPRDRLRGADRPASPRRRARRDAVRDGDDRLHHGIDRPAQGRDLSPCRLSRLDPLHRPLRGHHARFGLAARHAGGGHSAHAHAAQPLSRRDDGDRRPVGAGARPPPRRAGAHDQLRPRADDAELAARLRQSRQARRELDAHPRLRRLAPARRDHPRGDDRPSAARSCRCTARPSSWACR